MYNNLLRATIFITLIFGFSQCYEYVPDPLDPRLPKVSAKGENTAGAYIDGKPWIMRRTGLFQSERFSLQTIHDVVVLQLTGYLDQSSVTIEFHIQDLPTVMKDWVDKKIILDGQDNFAKIINEESCENINGVGQIYFYVVKESQNPPLLSGTFGFMIPGTVCTYKKVTHGRFDIQSYLYNR